jgi:hypothetical protein
MNVLFMFVAPFSVYDVWMFREIDFGRYVSEYDSV